MKEDKKHENSAAQKSLAGRWIGWIVSMLATTGSGWTEGNSK